MQRDRLTVDFDLALGNKTVGDPSISITRPAG